MCGSMVNVQSPTVDIMQGKKKKKKPQGKNIMSASATQGGHEKYCNMSSNIEKVFQYQQYCNINKPADNHLQCSITCQKMSLIV